MNLKKYTLVAFTFFVTGCASMADKPIPHVEQVAAEQPLIIAKPESVRPLLLDQVVISMEKGSVIGENRQGVICFLPKPRIWDASEPEVWLRGQYHDMFRSILKEYNYSTPTVPSESLFSEYKPTGQELIVRAKITEIHENFCSANGDESVGALGKQIYKGSIKFSVYWELYSIAEKKVVFKSKTFGSAIAEKFKPIGEHKYYKTAFGIAFKNLLSDKELNILLITPISIQK